MSTPTTLPEKGTKKLVQEGTQEGEDLVPLFNVVLLDDNDHTYDYVVEMLIKIFCVSVETAFRHAVEVDSAGRTIVITCERAQAEFGRDQIHAYGADPRMPSSKGSMRAIIEPARV
jgi:ATP-dependent Clp protease adaptor protein ClpS